MPKFARKPGIYEYDGIVGVPRLLPPPVAPPILALNSFQVAVQTEGNDQEAAVQCNLGNEIGVQTDSFINGPYFCQEGRAVPSAAAQPESPLVGASPPAQRVVISLEQLLRHIAPGTDAHPEWGASSPCWFSC